ncbi:MAG: exodeoxyribonuclease III [Neomegalonema sp.]|nr:exodeoxyribonuclease III [Neomegalonema sp.]
MRLSVATWNINSVRLRAGLVEKLLTETAPDILCLQETKAKDENFPADHFSALGYEAQAIAGEPSYNGVAILSRHPIVTTDRIDFCAQGDTRHIQARVALPNGVELDIHSLYVPAGGDVPDREENPKFDHKLRFVDEMAERWAGTNTRSIVMGDLNIAPLEADVWSHKQLLKVVSHTPIEVEKFEAAQRAGGWIDVTRQFTPVETKLYSWWSYRARDWAASDRGRRLDHIWASADLEPALRSSVILREARGWEKPSDHAPVFATLEF